MGLQGKIQWSPAEGTPLVWTSNYSSSPGYQKENRYIFIFKYGYIIDLFIHLEKRTDRLTTIGR